MAEPCSNPQEKLCVFEKDRNRLWSALNDLQSKTARLSAQLEGHQEISQELLDNLRNERRMLYGDPRNSESEGLVGRVNDNASKIKTLWTVFAGAIGTILLFLLSLLLNLLIQGKIVKRVTLSPTITPRKEVQHEEPRELEEVVFDARRIESLLGAGDAPDGLLEHPSEHDHD